MKILAEWTNETAVIFTNAPSTESVDTSLFDGKRVVAINSAYQRHRHADVLLSGDWRFFQGRTFPGFYGKEIICCSPRAWRDYGGVSTHPRAHYVGRGCPTGLESDRTKVSGRHTCVAQALSFCAHRGVNRILIVGLDLRAAPSGRRYAFLADRETEDAEQRYAAMAQNLATFAAPLRARGIEVINCNPLSALSIWPRTTLKEALGIC